jgi:hypothetical protein
MPAIPIIGLGISAFSAYKQSKAQGDAAKLQKQMFQQQSGLANTLQGFAQGQTTMAQPALNKAMQHYMTLANGSRGAIGAELAPDINGVTESYRGAEKGLSRATPAGPARDRAIADMYRSKAGQIGMMPFQARQQAFTGLENMGNHATGNALDAYRGAASALTGASTAGSNYSNAVDKQYGTYGSMITAGTQAGQSVWDWYKKRNSGVNGGWDPSSMNPGAEF